MTTVSSMNLQDCLPAELRGPTTAICRIAVGLSGAGVYRVEAGGEAFVLKIAPEGEPIATWRRRLEIQRSAASAGVAPRVVHADEERRAVVSALVVDRSFPALYGNPATREAAIALLGRTMRRVHELPIPPDAASGDPRALITALWSSVSTLAPAFVGDAVRRVLAEEVPAAGPPVLSHNDVNPTNLAYDGENLLLLDWDTAGPNDPCFDLAAIAVFFRMDDETCRKLFAAYGDAPATARFAYSRRLVAVMCGCAFLHLARLAGHPGGDETLESVPSLADFYQRMRTGELSIATADGKWRFGLALVKASTQV
jgi:aminoglycoside phosphotransferase (APT) family kinase protein